MFGFLTAVGFLTSMPPLLRRNADGGDVARSFSYFPLVGAALGLIAAAVDLALRQIFPIAAASALVLALLVLMTGALHLDGFIDCCDGLFGGKEPARRLEIMRDSRIGSFGAVGVCVLLIAKYAALISLPIAWRLPILVTFPAVGRWAMVYAAVSFPPGRADGLGSGVKAQLGGGQLIGATLIAAALCYAAMGARGILALFCAWVVTYLAVRYTLRKIPGLTGDTYGAINELVEVSALYGLPALILIPLGASLDPILLVR